MGTATELQQDFCLEMSQIEQVLFAKQNIVQVTEEVSRLFWPSLARSFSDMALAMSMEQKI